MAYTKTNFRSTRTHAQRVITTVSGFQNPAYHTRFKSWTDEVELGENPNWREDIKAGRQAATQLDGVKRTIRPFYFSCFADISYSTKPNPNWASHVGHSGEDFLDISSGPQPSTPSWDSANAIALKNYVSKAREYQTSFQGGVFLGELRETIRMLRSPMQTFRRRTLEYLDVLKKKRRFTTRQNSLYRVNRKSALADSWLEYSFGIVPLLNDISDIAETLTGSNRPDKRNIFGFGQDVQTLHKTVQLGIASTPRIIAVGRLERRFIVKYYGAMRTRTPNRLTNQRLGFDISNWLPTAWELLPWSFLADYFTNIGDIVSAATFAKNSLDWTVKTTVDELIFKPEGHYLSPFVISLSYAKASNGIRAYSAGGGSLRTVSRAPYYGSLIPPFQLEIPGIGKKWLNIAALARNARRLTPYY